MTNKDIEIIKTHTGKIYVDRKRKLEFLSVGDYGKENNIKADFLGYTKEINGVAHSTVDIRNKWVATISTQHGCPMKCTFCDVPKFGYHGNVSVDNLAYQLRTIMSNENLKLNPFEKYHTERFNVHFARMGEPTFNEAVLVFTKYYLHECVGDFIKTRDIHPVLSTMLPKGNKNLNDFLWEWCAIKNECFKGNAGLQFSINSTDEEQRNKQFNNQSLSLKEISEISKHLPYPNGRKYTLNFAVTKDTIIDVDVLDKLFNKYEFIVKITPIHETNNAISNGFDVGESYSDYSVYEKFEKPLIDRGWEVIVFVPSKEEDSDRITCGNALISDTMK